MDISNYLGGMESLSIPPNATLIEQSVYELRNLILRGELRPGQKLVEANLCQMLNISRASLREVLRALEAERLVQLVPNRGPSVVKLATQDIDAIHEVWALLTGQAVADFTQRADPTQIESLMHALLKLEDNVATAQPLGQLAAINAFFGIILKGCGNSVLRDMVISLVARVNFVRAQSLLHQGWGGLYAEEIKAIFAQIKAGDSEAARMATQSHVETACTAARKYTVDTAVQPAT